MINTVLRQHLSYLPNLLGLGMCELHAPYSDTRTKLMWYRVYGCRKRNGMCYSYGQTMRDC